MLNEILKTIVQLKAIEKKNPGVKVIIKQLEETVYSQINQNILEIISVGEYIGYDEIDKRLAKASSYISQIKKKQNKKSPKDLI